MVRNQSLGEISNFAATRVLSLARPKSLWQHRAMIEFRSLPDDHPDLARSPLLRAVLMTLRYVQGHGGIGLTTTMGQAAVCGRLY